MIMFYTQTKKKDDAKSLLTFTKRACIYYRDLRRLIFFGGGCKIYLKYRWWLESAEPISRNSAAAYVKVCICGDGFYDAKIDCKRRSHEQEPSKCFEKCNY